MKELEISRMPQLPFEVTEALNQLRINLGFCGDQIKTIMVTSSVPSEGKSFIAMQLWRMMAEVGTPPLASAADALNIARHCDGSVLVVQSGDTPRKVVDNSVQMLQHTETSLLGIVLNRADVNGRSSAYYNRYYHSSYYYKGSRYGYGYGGSHTRDAGKQPTMKVSNMRTMDPEVDQHFPGRRPGRRHGRAGPGHRLAPQPHPERGGGDRIHYHHRHWQHHHGDHRPGCRCCRYGAAGGGCSYPGDSGDAGLGDPGGQCRS